MKKTFFNIILFSIIGFSLGLWAASDLYMAGQEFMSLDKASAKWGHKPLSTDDFKKGDVNARSSMAVSIIKNKTFIGKTSAQVKETLGDPNGYFWGKAIPAYFLNEGWKEKSHETWQLVFLPDSQGKINDVRIHKNCCSKDASYDPTHLPKVLNDLKSEKSNGQTK